VRVLVIGGGLAGSLLAWRLAQRPGTTVEVRTGHAGAGRPEQTGGFGGAGGTDATGASGGAVRAYDTLPEQRELAIASLVELLGSRVLRAWAGYRETGFAYLRHGAATPGAGTALAAELAEIERALPGSADLTTPAEAFGASGAAGVFGDQGGGPGWAGDDTRVVVRERRAGQTSPGGLRDAVLADLAARPRAVLRDAPLDRLTAATAREYDAVVLAAGAWTPALLRASGLPAGGYRTRSIQYTVYDAGPVRPPAFTDEETGLYGLPTADGGLLLGVPTREWDVPPGATSVTLSRPGQAASQPDRPDQPASRQDQPASRQDQPASRPDQAARLAAECFPRLKLGNARRRVGAADCYCDPPVLALRRVSGPVPRLFTFTGGSGGCAKSALAASQRAAGQLTEAA
jgi:glycine/D-amino acid oxidase-like deaminating enzyme